MEKGQYVLDINMDMAREIYNNFMGMVDQMMCFQDRAKQVCMSLFDSGKMLQILGYADNRNKQLVRTLCKGRTRDSASLQQQGWRKQV